jgi:diguanylate cyclase (GGDEF)-like protein
LTQIPNRRFIDSIYIKGVVYDTRDFCLVFADLDSFKSINDNYGHDVGDEALVHAVDVFKSRVRHSDLLCRYGGEEFLICLPDTSLEQANKIAEGLRSELQKSPLIVSDDQCLEMTCSFGVASLSGRTFEEAVQIADNCLYKAKELGRNQVVSA